jgi:(p)ppGpp synthase/HD superfamily hydrolase
MDHTTEARVATPVRISDRSFDYDLDRALVFMAKTIDACGHNPKPLVLHSTRVGMYLYNYGCSRAVVLAGVLHDLIEDTSLPPEKIRQEFGEDVFRLVEANTFDATIADRLERARELFARCLAAGRDALLIKVADTLDNSHYIHLIQDEGTRQYVLAKIDELLTLSSDLLRDEPEWEELHRQWLAVQDRSAREEHEATGG